MDRDTSALTAAQRRHVRTARAMTVYSVCATPVIVVLWPLAEMAQTHGNGNPLWPQTVSLVLLLASCACMGPLIAARMRGEGVPDPRLYAASVLLAWTGALFLREETYMVCALASWLSVMTHLHRGARYPAVLGAATGLLPWIAWPFLHPDSPFAALLFVWLVGALLWGLFYLGCAVSFRLWDIVREAFSAQEAKARLAVAVERLRFTRDLQDLLGQDLNVLAVRAARAGRNVSRDPEQARAEAAEVHALARDALRRIRTAVSGYRELELAGEVRSVTAVLAAGGVRTSVAGLADLDPSPAEASLAAWTVREGGARLLRHGTAAHCRISFSRDPATGRAVVELSGDRARPGADPEPGGADGFADRVRREGGALTAGRTPEGGLLLRVRLPLDGSPSPAGEAR
ncbi:sensor histidine kinase [Nocardiopsis flavescens]|uniref:Two-component system, NarL family, sensor histidine kinase DesK n=1 Tax=Nocardiopsis flavescens TaxID=758803 RepID=A0A1M6N490_9ACTN|nr:two-component system, NarL family, sensor histidine kinase DesK [Nocardiopsis flavescens]